MDGIPKKTNSFPRPANGLPPKEATGVVNLMQGVDGRMREQLPDPFLLLKDLIESGEVLVESFKQDCHTALVFLEDAVGDHHLQILGENK